MGIKVFNQQEVLGKDFKIYGDAENPLFLAKDVAEWIEHSRASEMIKSIDEDEKLVQTILASGQNREMWFLTEDGVYEVLMQSRKPIAKQFKKKVKEIIKDIRKHGLYMTDSLLEQTLNNPDYMIQVLSNYKEEKEKRIALEHKIEEQEPLVTFAEKCLKSKTLLLVRQLAKIISEQGTITIGEKKLYQKLRGWGLVIKGGSEPTQRAMNMEVFEVVQRTYSKGEYEILTHTTKITPKGQMYIIKRLAKEIEKGKLVV